MIITEIPNISLFAFCLQLDLFLEYVFYDFNDDRADISTYDVNECFDPSDQYTFQITFPGE